LNYKIIQNMALSSWADSSSF